MTPQRSSSSRARAMRPRSASGAIGGFIGALCMSLVAGVLVTAAVTPVVALSGSAASTAIDIFENLPSHLNPGQLAEPSTIYAKKSDGTEVELATFYDQNRETVSFDEISQFAKDAAVAEEDPRFYTHGGVDVLATGRAVLQNTAGESISGASTITMQYVRNVLIQEAYSIVDEEEREAAYKDAIRQDIDRKLKEMKYAISIEKQYSKDEILLGYLNISLFGRQIYGIESAANYYYGKSARDVTLAEAASLVAIVNNPSELQIDIEENLPANKARRDKILGSMLKHGKITQEQYDEAVATEVEPKITPREAGCAIAERSYSLGNFCDYVIRYIKQDPSFGENPTDREFQFSRGGYKIITTIDLDIQKAGVDAMRATVPATMGGIDPGGASVSTEVGSGRVLAMVQNKYFSIEEDWVKNHPDYTGINYNTDYEYGGSSGFQVGSTFKSFTLAEWIRTGHSVREVVNMRGRTVQEESFRAKCLPGGVYGYGQFTFQNDNSRGQSNGTVLTTIGQSLNGGVVSMQQQLDLCDTFNLAQDLGVHRASDQPNEGLPNYGTRDLTMVPSNVYGGIDEISPITMATSYAAFAGGGETCSPVPIDSITDTNGDPVPFTKSKCSQAISPEVAAGVAYVLQYNITNGLGGFARSSIGTPHLAKTGTTDDVIDNWTVGASSKVSTATWVGNAGPVQRADGSWSRVSTQGTILMLADQTIWPAMMNVADQKYGGDPFPEPESGAIKQTLVEVPDVKGMSFDEAKNLLEDLRFQVSDGGEVDSDQPQGSIARTDPDVGSSAPQGSGITLYRSNGQGATVPDVVGLTGSAAKTALANEGFSNVRSACRGGGSPDDRTDTVRSVSPGAGSEINRSDRVSLTMNCS